MSLRGVWRRAGSRLKDAGLMLLLAIAFAPAALADVVEVPLPWQIGMQPAASPVREHIDALHNEILVIITLITAVRRSGLLLYVIVRFNAKRTLSRPRSTHNPADRGDLDGGAGADPRDDRHTLLQAHVLHGQGANTRP